MRLAYVSADPGVPVYGSKGASVHVQEVIRALLQRGAEVTLVTTRVGGEAPPDLAGVQVVELPKLPKGEPAQRERAALSGNAALAELLGREGPFDAVYERYSLWSYAGMETARRWGVAGLLEVNAPLIDEQRLHRGLVHADEAYGVAERVFGAATALLPVSSAVGRYLESFSGVADKIHVTPNGVNPARFLPNRPDPAAFTVGFVGTLKPWHGVEVLLAAFAGVRARVPGARLLIVGAGPEAARLEAEAVRLGLAGAVEFTGAVAPERVPALLARMDVAVAPYPELKDFYFSPLKVYEYMAAGVPVVASRVGQLAELIDGRNGLLLPPGDAGALADALVAISGDAARRRRLAEAGRATILRAHTWERVAARIVGLAKLGALQGVR
jgi:glycosyltransferase involved in cell wall biosynthesis